MKTWLPHLAQRIPSIPTGTAGAASGIATRGAPAVRGTGARVERSATVRTRNLRARIRGQHMHRSSRGHRLDSVTPSFVLRVSPGRRVDRVGNACRSRRIHPCVVTGPRSDTGPHARCLRTLRPDRPDDEQDQSGDDGKEPGEQDPQQDKHSHGPGTLRQPLSELKPPPLFRFILPAMHQRVLHAHVVEHPRHHRVHHRLHR